MNVSFVSLSILFSVEKLSKGKHKGRAKLRKCIDKEKRWKVRNNGKEDNHHLLMLAIDMNTIHEKKLLPTHHPSSVM